MSDENLPQDGQQSTPQSQMPEAPKAVLPEAPVVAPAPEVAAETSAPVAPAMPSFELPKAKFGIANKAGSAIHVSAPVKKDENPSILSILIEGAAAAVAVAFAILIVLDI